MDEKEIIEIEELKSIKAIANIKSRNEELFSDMNEIMKELNKTYKKPKQITRGPNKKTTDEN